MPIFILCLSHWHPPEQLDDGVWHVSVCILYRKLYNPDNRQHAGDSSVTVTVVHTMHVQNSTARLGHGERLLQVFPVIYGLVALD